MPSNVACLISRTTTEYLAVTMVETRNQCPVLAAAPDPHNLSTTFHPSPSETQYDAQPRDLLGINIKPSFALWQAFTTPKMLR